MRRKPFLRQYADEPGPLLHVIHEGLDELPTARAEGDTPHLIAVLGQLGEAYRSLGRLEQALPYAREAYELAVESSNRKAMISNGLRLATLLQYRNEHAEAEPLFRETLELARRMHLLEDFACQHMGKCLAELGQLDEAIACFERALALRAARGEPSLIASSREALDLALEWKARQEKGQASQAP